MKSKTTAQPAANAQKNAPNTGTA